jgi:hypothetical protein
VTYGHIVGFAVYFGCVILAGLQIVGLRRGNLLRRGLLRFSWLLTWLPEFLYLAGGWFGFGWGLGWVLGHGVCLLWGNVWV